MNGTTKILSSEVRKATCEAQRIKADAKIEAQKIIRNAQRRVSELFSETKIKAVKEAKEELADSLLSINRRRHELECSMESDLCELAIDIAQKLVCASLNAKPDLVLEKVRNGLELLRNHRKITLSLHPADKNRFSQILMKMKQDISVSSELHIVENNALKEGDCILSSNTEIVDLTVQSGVNLVRHSLLKPFQESR